MSKTWQPYARHILDAIAKIRRIQARGAAVIDKHLQALEECIHALLAEGEQAD